MLRIGLVGLGGIAAVHICAYRRLEDVKIVAAVDSMGKGARSYPLIADSGVTLYDSIDDMLMCEELDAVDICAPTFLHEELAIKSLRAGSSISIWVATPSLVPFWVSW